MKIINCSKDIAQKLFLFLNERNIRYAVLGDTSSYPEIKTDLDLCSSSFQDFISAIKDFCISTDVSLLNLTVFSNGIRFDFSKTNFTDKIISLLTVDLILFPTWKIRGNVGLSFSELIDSRKINSFGFFVPLPSYAFLFHLLKYVDKRGPQVCHWNYLARLWTTDPGGIRQILPKIWSNPLSNLITRAAESGSWDEVKAAFPDLRRELIKKSAWDIQRAIWISKRLLSRIFSPVGLHVAFLGPDGSGKSSVIARVFPNHLGLFRDTFYNHLRPGLGRKKGQKPVIDPHGQAPRSLALSVVKVLYLWFDYFVGWWLIVWPKRVHLNLTLFDRYYHDMLVDPLRYRYGGPMWLARWVGKLIPKPDIWILLDAPPEVLQERKQEVPFEETARQRKEYLKLIKGMENGVVIDSSKSLDEVVGDVHRAIVDFMAQRTEKRLGL